MIEERKDYRLKYVDVTRIFYSRANDVNLACKQSQRICEQLVHRLAKVRPKSPNEFEQHEFMKDFVLKTAKTNEEILNLLNYTHGFLQDVVDDAKVLIDGAVIRDRLREQSDKIEALIMQRDSTVNQIYNEVSTRIKGNPQ